MSLRYSGGIVSNIRNGYNSTTTTVEYLLVAGGGGGQAPTPQSYPFGGSGAGGVLTSTGFDVTAGSVITITIGAGGAVDGYNGSDSTLAGNITITTTGGGGGSGWPSAGQAGGSSGGTCYSSTGAPVSGQGHSGGISTAAQGAGGGGGAGGPGVAGEGNHLNGGAGGAGIVSCISGSPIQYAGGGGGGGRSYGANTAGGLGCGGGGDGGHNSFGKNGGKGGQENTGGGGGAGATGQVSDAVSGRGGSGICILRYPSYLNQAQSTTGSPNMYITGYWRVYKFVASGTITF